MNRRLFVTAVCSVSLLTGCDKLPFFGKKSEATATADAAKTADPAKTTDAAKPTGDAPKQAAAPSAAPAKSADAATAPATDSPTWTEQVTGSKTPMVRLDLGPGGLDGYTMLGTKDTKVAKSPGGHGAELSDDAYGFNVWVHEDAQATVALLKTSSQAWNSKSKVVEETPNSIIVSQPDLDGKDAFYFRGVMKVGDKSFVCETPTSVSPGALAHAQAIGKACMSLEGHGGKVEVATADSATPADTAKPDDAPTVAANDPPGDAAHNPTNAPTPPPKATTKSTTTTPPKATATAAATTKVPNVGALIRPHKK